MSNSTLKQQKAKLNVGALLVYVGIGAFFLIIIIQFVFLMTTKSLNDEDLVAHGEAKYLRTAINEAERGDIVDRHGNVLASDMNTYKLAVIVDETYLEDALDVNVTARTLSEIIDMSYEDIKETIDYGIENNRFQVEFGTSGRDLTYNEKTALEESEINGLVLEKDKRRLYPNGDFASNLIGFAERESTTGKIIGQMGVENAYNEFLLGEDGRIDFTQDLWNYVVPNSDEQYAPEHGYTVELTIDSNIQIFLEDSLDLMDEHFKPDAVFATVMDVKSGEILATGQRPSFNPETREGLDKSWTNVLYETAFEPGSTFKIFGIAAAIDAGEYAPDDTFQSGSVTIDDFIVQDWNQEGWGRLTYNEGLQYSSNALMMTLQDRVGADEMYKYYQDFGFVQSTGSEFPNEAVGHLNWQYELDRKAVSFGQSIAVTPIQMLQATTAIFNDGVMKKPYVIKNVTNPNTGEVVYKGEETNVRQVLSKDAAEKTIEELNQLVGGSTDRNRAYMLEDYTVSGKTGTAQVIDPESGSYLFGDYQYLTSFIGYAPAEDPQVVIYYSLRLPTENQPDAWNYGVSLGFNPLMERTLKYLDADNNEEAVYSTALKLEDFTGRELSQMQSHISQREANNVIIGNGTTVLEQYPASGSLHSFEHLIVLTDGEVSMPDLSGLSKREVYIVLDMLDLDGSVIGEGYVQSQSIEAGQPIQENSILEITLTSEHMH